MFGHDGEGVELVSAFGAVVDECVEEELGVFGGLEEGAALPGDGSDGIGGVHGWEMIIGRG